MKLIAGLGNPGQAYARTRHNIGAMAVDRLSEKSRIPLDRSAFECAAGSGLLCDQEVLLARPLSYMNRSGEAIVPLAAQWDIKPQDILIVHDDMDFPFGSMRLKVRGGSGGHRGVASIIEHLGTDLFARLRLGIDRPPGSIAASEYVLESFTPAELKLLDGFMDKACQCIEELIQHGHAAAMNRFHPAAH